ncbi:MAG: glycosyltransferase [Lachnospiraceae bacterium]|nr:glycosyltransferase [Lachnospiraceae bacterium]
MIYVITAVHNRIETTRIFINKLNQQTINESIMLVLVDDGCTDGTVEMAQKQFSNIHIIAGDGNLWWAGAMDVALRWVNSVCKKDDMVLISNDDVDFDENYIERGISKLIKEPRNTLVSGIGVSINTHQYKTTPIFWDLKKGRGYPVGPNEYSNCVATRSLFFYAEAIRNIGYFHPKILPHYQSDYEWTIRAVKRGYTIKCYDDLTYSFDEKTCGYGNFRKLTYRQVFSKKSSCNPFYRFTFYVLVTPLHVLPVCLVNQVRRLFKNDKNLS